MGAPFVSKELRIASESGYFCLSLFCPLFRVLRRCTLSRGQFPAAFAVRVRSRADRARNMAVVGQQCGPVRKAWQSRHGERQRLARPVLRRFAPPATPATATAWLTTHYWPRLQCAVAPGSDRLGVALGGLLLPAQRPEGTPTPPFRPCHPLPELSHNFWESWGGGPVCRLVWVRDGGGSGVLSENPFASAQRSLLTASSAR